MSVRIMSQVWEKSELKGEALIVLLALADWANDDGVCWPSLPKVADKARVSKGAVSHIIHRLANDGFITIHETGSGRGHTSRYSIHPMPKRAEKQAAKGSFQKDLSENTFPEKVIPEKTFLNAKGSSGKVFSEPRAYKENHQSTINEPLKSTLTREQNSENAENAPHKSAGNSNLQNVAEKIYNAYPRKVAKPKALASIAAALKRIRAGDDAPPDAELWPPPSPDAWLLDRTALFALSDKGNAGEYTPHPATWFNQARYADNPSEWQEKDTKNANTRFTAREQSNLRSRDTDAELESIIAASVAAAGGVVARSFETAQEVVSAEPLCRNGHAIAAGHR